MADAVTRTEPATPKRRADARRHGQVVVSPAIAPVAVLLAVLVLATWGAPVLLHRTSALVAEWLAAAGPIAAGNQSLAPLASRAAGSLAGVLAPFLLAVAAVGLGAGAAQVGWHPNPARVLPDPTRIGLAAGWKRLASVEGTATLVRALVTIVLVATVGGRMLAHVGGTALGASALPVEGVLALAGSGLREVALVLVGVLAVVAAADHGWARWRHAERLRMSRHELREERKQSEGDPSIRARFRRAHRAIAGRRMLDEVARADVVLASPAHVAVALRYRADESGAARVLAKGAGDVAERIAAAARAAGVPVVERRALARALVRAVPIGSDIPRSFYPGVAEVLAHVHVLRTQRGSLPGAVA
jgi:flagellar biosynthetic protein FlhB